MSSRGIGAEAYLRLLSLRFKYGFERVHIFPQEAQ